MHSSFIRSEGELQQTDSIRQSLTCNSACPSTCDLPYQCAEDGKQAESNTYGEGKGHLLIHQAQLKSQNRAQS
jgi:hypothetical protein